MRTVLEFLCPCRISLAEDIADLQEEVHVLGEIVMSNLDEVVANQAKLQEAVGQLHADLSNCFGDLKSEIEKLKEAGADVEKIDGIVAGQAALLEKLAAVSAEVKANDPVPNEEPAAEAPEAESVAVEESVAEAPAPEPEQSAEG